MARSIKKDKKVKALHAGKRESKKGAKNQFGKSKGGNTYYENRTNRSDKNRTKKFDGGGSLQSMTTRQLAEKAGMTMDEVNQFDYDRNDLIAMITEGNYKKGGQTKTGIKQDKNIKALHAGKRTSEDGNTYYESRPNRSDKNRTKKFAGGGSLQSMTTKQLAEKAGVSSEEMQRDNLHREDLIAMITQGNYKKGGGVGKKVNSFKVGDKVYYANEGVFGWEELNEAEHAGLLGSETLTVSEVDNNKKEPAIKLEETGDTWIHPNHFELKEMKKGGGVGEKSHEDLVNEKLDSGGEISCDEFKKIIGREPCYPVCHVGGSKYRKQFLRGCYRKI